MVQEFQNPKCLAYCYLTQYFCLISDFKNWVKKLFLAYFYRSFSLPHNIAVRRPILKFKTIFYIYIQFPFILYKVNFLWDHYFWVKIAFEVWRSEIVIIFPKQVLFLYNYPVSWSAMRLGLFKNQFSVQSMVTVKIRKSLQLSFDSSHTYILHHLHLYILASTHYGHTSVFYNRKYNS